MHPWVLYTLSLVVGHAVSSAALAFPGPESEAAHIAARPTYAGVPTQTKVLTTTTSVVIPFDWLWTHTWSGITTMTITTYEPGPFTAVPTTITQWVVTTAIIEGRDFYPIQPSTPTARTDISFSTWIGTAPETWVLYHPEATHMPVGGNLPCDLGTGPSTSAPPDPECVRLGLYTGCQGQCEERPDGLLWCLQRWYGSQTEFPAMGRACWGGEWVFKQLMKPCHVDDYLVGCTPEKGQNSTWSGAHWIGPGAEGGPLVR